MNKSIVKYGFLGASQILKNQHLQAVQQAINAEGYGIASRRKSKAQEFADNYSIPRVYDNYEQMLADPEIDAVINTLPMKLHTEWVIKAAEAGKHCLCEKPMALSTKEMSLIIDAAKHNNVKIMEGFTPWFLPQMDYVKNLLSSGKIGEIRVIKAEVIYGTEDWENDSRANVELGGCVTIEAGCYSAFAIHSLMDDMPEKLTGYSVQGSGNEGLDTSFVGIMKFPNNRLGMMSTSMETAFRASVEIFGTRGRIDIPDFFGGVRIVITPNVYGQAADEVIFPVENRFKNQIEHFSDCILTDRPPKVSLEDSFRTITILEKMVSESKK
jgi:xylose dehydrogenase (NAD/NADP)